MIPLRDNLSCKGNAIATIILIAINCVAFGIELAVPEPATDTFFNTWAVVPAKISAALSSGDPALIGMAALTILTAMFLHGGLMHLIGNMIFLQAFGRAVENRLGTWRFVLFYLLGGFVAWVLHFLTAPNSLTPALGASGAIAAILGAYLLFYPKAKFRTLFMVGPLPLLVSIRAYWFLVIWFASQLLPGISGLINPASAGIAYWAHIGGFVAGVGLAALWATFYPVSNVCYSPDPCGKGDFSLLWYPFKKAEPKSDDTGNDTPVGADPDDKGEDKNDDNDCNNCK